MKASAALIASLLLCGTAHAAEVKVQDAWARGTVPAQKTTGAFLEITSSEDVAVVGATSPVAGAVEIHTMKMEDGVMKMRSLPRLELPAGKTVRLAPGGNHIMLMDLKQQLKRGDTVPITLKVEDRAKGIKNIEVKAEVRDLTSPSAKADSHKH